MGDDSLDVTTDGCVGKLLLSFIAFMFHILKVAFYMDVPSDI